MIKSFTKINAILLITIFLNDSIKIGSQTWADKNLDVTYFRNGDKIKQITSGTEWMMAGINKEPAWCYFEFDAENGKKYGKLYNGFAVLDKRGLAPKGWRIPSDADFKKLENHIDKNANKLKADNSTETGFTALYSGNINFSGSFMGELFCVWTASKSGNKVFYRKLNNYNIGIDRKLAEPTQGYAVRCIK